MHVSRETACFFFSLAIAVHKFAAGAPAGTNGQGGDIEIQHSFRPDCWFTISLSFLKAKAIYEDGPSPPFPKGGKRKRGKKERGAEGSNVSANWQSSGHPDDSPWTWLDQLHVLSLGDLREWAVPKTVGELVPWREHMLEQHKFGRDRFLGRRASTFLFRTCWFYASAAPSSTPKGLE